MSAGDGSDEGGLAREDEARIMELTSRVMDVGGRVVKKGDTVATINDNLTAKVCDVRVDGETGFVRLRLAHQPYSRGVWHAADHVQLIFSAPE